MKRALTAAILALLTVCTCPGAGGTDLLQQARELHRTGRLEKALLTYESAQAALAAEGDDVGLAVCLNNASVILQGQGKAEAALEMASEAVRLRKGMGDLRLAGRSLTNLGRALADLGRFSAAEAAFRDALHAAEEADEGRDQVVNLVNLGVLAQQQALYGDAMDAVKLALAIVESATGEGWAAAQRIILLNNRGVIYERIGEFRRALADYDQILELVGHGAATVPYQVNAATILRNLGDPHLALQRLRLAEEGLGDLAAPALRANLLSNIGLVLHLDLERYDEALAVLTHARMLAREAGDSGEALIITNALAAAQMDAGNADDAAANLLQALAGDDTDLEPLWQSHLLLGRVLQTQGDGAGALRALRTSAALIEGSRANLLRVFTARRFLADRLVVYASMAEILGHGGGTAATLAALAAMERPRLRLFESAWKRQLAAASGSAAGDQDQEDRLRILNQAAARMYASPTPESISAWEAAEQPWRLSPIPELISNLEDDEIVIEFLVTERRALAVWLGMGRAGMLELGDVAALDMDIATWRNAILHGPADEPALGQRLFDRLLAPALAGTASAPRRLIVIPDGSLWQLPWVALPTRIGTNGVRRLLEDVEVVLSPSASFLLGGSLPAPGGNSGSAFFGPPSPPPPGLRPLPEAEREAAAVRTALGDNVDVIIGAASTEARFRLRAALPSQVLHLATHAHAEPLDVRRTGIHFSQGATEGGSDDDGFLSLDELRALPVSADVAVLSACSGAVGEQLPAEGPESLAAGFLEAGAGSVITSLWEVEDTSARALMEQFYARAGGGADLAAALRQAQLALLASGGDLSRPRHWGAWVLVGHAPRLARPLSRTTWLVLAAVLFLVGAAGLLAARRLRGRS